MGKPVSGLEEVDSIPLAEVKANVGEDDDQRHFFLRIKMKHSEAFGLDHGQEQADEGHSLLLHCTATGVSTSKRFFFC